MSNFPVRGVRGEEPHAVAEAVKYLRKGWRRPMQTLVRLDNGKVVLGRRCDAGRLSPPAKQIQQRQQPPMVIPLDNAGIPDASTTTDRGRSFSFRPGFNLDNELGSRVSSGRYGGSNAGGGI